MVHHCGGALAKYNAEGADNANAQIASTKTCEGEVDLGEVDLGEQKL